MTPPTTQNSNQVHPGRIWECLNAEAVTTSGSPEDDIGLDDVVGVDLWEESGCQTAAQGNRKATYRPLPEAEIEGWLKTPKGTVGQNGEKLFGKVLVGNQVKGNDFLRPPKDAAAVRFSRQTLGETFRLPPAAIARISYRQNWYFGFTGYHSSSSVSCEGLGTSTFSVAISLDDDDGTVFAVVIFYRQIRQDARESFIQELKDLSYLSAEPAWVPYLVMNLCIRISSELLGQYTQAIRKTDVDLQRFAKQRHIDSIFGEAHGRAGSVGGIYRDAQYVLKMANKWTAMVKKKPRRVSQGTWIQTKAGDTELRNGILYCTQVLRVIADDASQSQEQTTRQLNTALSMLAYEQQEASKVIAEETKKDGYSMKTLAVVTILFLPGTAVSSVLAMPLFRWDADNENDVVNSKLWVYFVLAIPLTGVTVGLWWLWQKRVIKGPRKPVSNC